MSGHDRPIRVSVIVPHYHDLPSLETCLQALTAQTYPRDQFEIVVGDNASPEGEAAVSQGIGGRARLVAIPERGAGAARNGAVGTASGEVLAFTDCDCQPDPRWLTEGVAALSTADFVGGAMVVLVGNRERLTSVEAFETVFAFNNERYVKREGFTVTANLFCSRSVFDAVGGFGVGVSEDIDWSHRAREAGYTIGYAGNAIVGHPARRTWAELLAKRRRVNMELYALSRRRAWGRLRWLVRALLTPASAVAHTPRVLLTDKLSSLGERLAALGVLYRLSCWRLADALQLLANDRSA